MTDWVQCVLIICVTLVLCVLIGNARELAKVFKDKDG